MDKETLARRVSESFESLLAEADTQNIMVRINPSLYTRMNKVRLAPKRKISWNKLMSELFREVIEQPDPTAFLARLILTYKELDQADTQVAFQARVDREVLQSMSDIRSTLSKRFKHKIKWQTIVEIIFMQKLMKIEETD